MYTEVVIGALVVFDTMQLEIATVPEEILEITVEADVPTFFAAYEVFE